MTVKFATLFASIVIASGAFFSSPCFADCGSCSYTDDAPPPIIGAAPVTDCGSCNYSDEERSLPVLGPAPTAGCSSCD
ncbi:hypothetical protein [Bradyrhizobium japonicum]|uniref:hypothetical protein n=1 Tax=Bradyrhizobium japonicum TaxID=375 RepID=UPI001B8A0CB7|nr:hypothetical protein [Bradyrhizobium japonicum]MBR0975673.1 hypothetical protein [Bradyrhizobium japonicum]